MSMPFEKSCVSQRGRLPSGPRLRLMGQHATQEVRFRIRIEKQTPEEPPPGRCECLREKRPRRRPFTADIDDCPLETQRGHAEGNLDVGLPCDLRENHCDDLRSGAMVRWQRNREIKNRFLLRHMAGWIVRCRSYQIELPFRILPQIEPARITAAVIGINK